MNRLITSALTLSLLLSQTTIAERVQAAGYSLNNSYAAVQSLKPLSNIDSVKSGQGFLKGTRVSFNGWAINKDGIKAVNVFVNNAKAGAANYGTVRADVNKAYPAYKNSKTSGFSYVLDTSNLDLGENTVLFQFIGTMDDIHEQSIKIMVNTKPEYVKNMNYRIGDYVGTYTGYIVNNKPHGQGSFYTEEPTAIFDSQMNLKFTMTGNWVYGQLNGQGIETWENGKEYVGEFKNSVYEGKGTMTYKTGDIYSGQWKASDYEGQGTYTWKSGNKYVGQFKNGAVEGQGTMTWINGDKYVGQWKDNKREGQGTMTWSNGTKYVGQFKNNIIEGQGTITWKSGQKFVGQFRNGQPVR